MAGIGLDRRSELVYRKLLLRARWRTDELAGALGWPEGEVVALVEGLRADGLASGSGDVGGAVRAVEPCIALPALLARRMRQGRAPQPRPVEVERFISLHERAAERTGGPIAASDSWDNASVTIERMVAKVEREIVFLVPGYVEGAFELSRPIVDMALRRGATVRAVWASSVLQTPAAAAHAQWLAEQDTPPRSVGVVPFRAVIMDGVVAVLLNDADRVRVIRAPAELERLGALADRLWEHGAAVRQAGRPAYAGGARRPRSEIVLRLLAEGLTDDAIARRLGCSVRTVRNDVASAMVALDARSRFQAGVRAMQVGLV
ncbi:helix-turn-helix transcriptional regulator [Streptomyces sp. TP-A0874]|uniref:helix-turn-helix transcriptional regulator n=1 Tax=Streptomyces sp. TP-A0874 TaxID=549819 RepID=UPI000A63EA71|nr:LuxR C-terminal-related transcriptional regulator [Streptomyces sp. TP-A0874]